MKINISVKGIKKPVFSKADVVSFIKETAEDMKETTKDFAPEDTSTLKNHGIEREEVGASIYGEKVFLDTAAIRSNYPDERQQRRPDGGNYGYYQEVGYLGRAGKHYFERAFNITEYEAESRLQAKADDFVKLK